MFYIWLLIYSNTVSFKKMQRYESNIRINKLSPPPPVIAEVRPETNPTSLTLPSRPVTSWRLSKAPHWPLFLWRHCLNVIRKRKLAADIELKNNCLLICFIVLTIAHYAFVLENVALISLYFFKKISSIFCSRSCDNT